MEDQDGLAFFRRVRGQLEGEPWGKLSTCLPSHAAGKKPALLLLPGQRLGATKEEEEL